MNNHLTILAIFVGSILIVTLLGGCVNCSPAQKSEGMKNFKPPSTVQQSLPVLPSMGAPIAAQKQQKQEIATASAVPSGFDYSDMSVTASDLGDSQGMGANSVSGGMAQDVSAGAFGKPILSNR